MLSRLKHPQTLTTPSRFLNKHRWTRYDCFMQRRSVRLPPSKYELLIQARGMLQRLNIRIRYPLMKQIRPFTLNDISALFSWVFVGHTLWLVVGTTSFISLVLWTANSLKSEDWIIHKTSRFLSLATGTDITFASATPNWKDGKIRFDHFRIVRMPLSDPSDTQNPTSLGLDPDLLKPTPWFDLSADSLEFELSMLRWMSGKGWVKTAHIKGVRGLIDNRKSNKNTSQDPVSVRKNRHPTGLEIDRLFLEDASLTVYMPGGFRPFPISVLQAQFSHLRKQWLLLDILSADYLVGSIDTSVFTIRPSDIEKSVLDCSALETEQTAHHLSTYYPYKKMNPQGVFVSQTDPSLDLTHPAGYLRKSRISIIHLNLDHAHRLGKGPPQWITSGTLDFCADLYLSHPSSPPTPSLWAVTVEIIQSMLPASVILGWGNNQVLLRQPVQPRPPPERQILMDIDLRFKDIKGSLPRHAPQFNALSHTMIRPVLAYINRNRTLVPIKGRFQMPLHHFDGAYTLQEAALTHHLNRCITQACIELAQNHQQRNKQLKKIGFWSFREIVRNLTLLHDSLKLGTRGFWGYLDPSH